MVESFFPISLTSLRIDSVPSFDLHLFQVASGKYVLYREKDIPFTEKVLTNLIDNRHTQLHVPRDQRDNYFDYSSRLVAAVIRDESIPISEKSEVVYNTTASIMEDLFITPRSSTRIRQAKDTMDNIVDYLAHDEEAARSMLFLTNHDYYTYTHSVNVAIFSTALAQRVFGNDHPDHDLKIMGEGFLLHDIGKSRIPAAIINKPGKLTTEEWALMKRHPEDGHRILIDTHQSAAVIDQIVLHHHERPDGTGYPFGLRLEEIHPYARVCCIADVFDAITTVRSYRDPLGTFDALRVMRDDMGDHFDWDFFNEFVLLFADK